MSHTKIADASLEADLSIENPQWYSRSPSKCLFSHPKQYFHTTPTNFILMGCYIDARIRCPRLIIDIWYLLIVIWRMQVWQNKSNKLKKGFGWEKTDIRYRGFCSRITVHSIKVSLINIPSRYQPCNFCNKNMQNIRELLWNHTFRWKSHFYQLGPAKTRSLSFDPEQSTWVAFNTTHHTIHPPKVFRRVIGIVGG